MVTKKFIKCEIRDLKKMNDCLKVLYDDNIEISLFNHMKKLINSIIYDLKSKYGIISNECNYYLSKINNNDEICIKTIYIDSLIKTIKNEYKL